MFGIILESFISIERIIKFFTRRQPTAQVPLTAAYLLQLIMTASWVIKFSGQLHQLDLFPRCTIINQLLKQKKRKQQNLSPCFSTSTSTPSRPLVNSINASLRTSASTSNQPFASSAAITLQRGRGTADSSHGLIKWWACKRATSASASASVTVSPVELST